MLLKWVKIFSTLAILFIAILYYLKMDQINFIQDDAYITLRYVNNFVEGNGLIFNEGERVEGYTNLLWVLILSLFAVISKLFSLQLDLANVSQALSVLFGFGTLLVSFFFTMKLIKKKNAEPSLFENISIYSFPLIPTFLLMLSAPMLYWGISGMETTLFTFLTLISLYRYFDAKYENGPDIIFVIVSVLNTLTRPEGLLVYMLIISWSIFNRFKSFKRRKNTFQKIFSIKVRKELIFYFIPVAFYIGFRIIYYGYPLPNTFYAKTGFNMEHLLRGVYYVLGSFRENYTLGILLLLPLIGLREPKMRSEISFFYFFVILYLISVILIGGDVLPIDRFILPIVPLIFSFAAVSIYQINIVLKHSWKKFIYMVLVLIAVVFLGLMNYESRIKEINTKRSYEVGLVKKMKIYAEWIKKQHQSEVKSMIKKLSDVKVALSTIGALSYFSDATIIDLVGLTDEYTAHNPKEVPGIDEDLPVLWKEKRYNVEYVLSRQPDYIIFPAGAKPTAFAECALFVQPEFYKFYYIQLIYSDELKQLLPVFSRREELLILSQNDCDAKFVKPFIEANNLFLSMTTTGEKDLLDKIIDKTDEAVKLCPERISDINAVRGYAYYHSGEIENSKLNFEKCIEKDPLNMIARYYLMKINHEEGNEMKMIEQIRMLKKYSPEALPNLYGTN
jgi:arabinofuranosyltransferase